jgi:spore maturation protein CgeB
VSTGLSEILASNLKALLSTNPALAERVCLPVDSDHVQPQPDGSTLYRWRNTLHLLDLTEVQCKEALEGLDSNVDVLLFGVGTGDMVDRLLDYCDGASVAAWDRDPWLLRQLLERRDYSELILSGRLIFALGMDILDYVPALKLGGQLVTHPLLEHVYSNELRLLTDGRGERAALICEGGLLVDDLATALRDEGYSVATWNISKLAEDELQHTATRLQPQLVASVNYSHGLAEACEEAKLPLIVWEIDPSSDEIKHTDATTTSHIFTYRAEQEQAYRDAGFPRVEYLPLAANCERRHPVELDSTESDRYSNPISFVGNSMTALGNQHRQRFVELYKAWSGDGSEDDATTVIAAVLELQAADRSRYLIPEVVQEHLGAFSEAMMANDPSEHPIILLGEMAAADKRLTFIADLGQVDIAVWGDEGWKDTEEYGVRYMGPAGHREELNRIYSGSLINLDIGRIYQNDIVTLRVFDALACGGFVLAEHSEALTKIFDIGTELDSYRTREELLQKVGHYLDHPEEARAIAERGMARVRRDHTIASRLRYMLSTAGLRQAANH